MRILSMMFASLLLGGVMAAQAPVATRAQAVAAKSRKKMLIERLGHFRRSGVNEAGAAASTGISK